MIALVGMSACSIDAVVYHTCGNGSLDPGEICDGNMLIYGAACPEGTYLPKNAILGCNTDCSLNTDVCIPIETDPSCGNGELDDNEICDADKVSDNAACPKGTHLPADAELTCNNNCTLNTDACITDESAAICGNDKLDDGEICDGSHISETASCPEGTHLAEEMELTCEQDCTLNLSGCENDASDTIPQGRILADPDNPELTEISIHRTPQDNYPNHDLYSDRDNEPSQIVMQIPIDEVVDISGIVGDRWLVQYDGKEGYIHSKHVKRINQLEVPTLDYTSAPTSNYYQMDSKWKDTTFGNSNYTIEGQGGGPTCVSDALSALKYEALTPDIIAKGMGPTFGTSPNHVCEFIEKQYRLKCNFLDNKNGMNCVTKKTNDASVRSKAKEQLISAFKKGWYIIAEVGENNSPYWEADRNVLVYGYDSEHGKVFFDDPRNRHYMADIESFLDCNHTMSIVTDTCIPLTCLDVKECGEVSDGCGSTMDCPCKPMGKALKDTYLRRSPQNKYSQTNYTNGLLNTSHTSELKNGDVEEAQIAGTLKKDTEVEILSRIKNNSMTPVWYQVLYQNNKYFVLANDLQKNSVEVKDLSNFPGATSNYAQGDAEWGNMQYSGSNRTIATDGCGPSSMANALSTLLGKRITPAMVANEFKQSGSENTQQSGTMSDNRMCNISTIKSNNIKCEFELFKVCGERTQTEHKEIKNKLIDKLNAGNYLVVYHEGQGYWTNAGHYVTLYGYDGEYFYADDPMVRRYHQNADEFAKTVRGVAYLQK